MLRTKPVALATRLYLLGIGITGGLWGLALAFPQIPATIVLATVGVVFLSFASWAHRYFKRTDRSAATTKRGCNATPPSAPPGPCRP